MAFAARRVLFQEARAASAPVLHLLSEYDVTQRNGGLNVPMALIPDIAVFQRKLATLPLMTYQAGEIVLSAGLMTGRRLILKGGRGRSR